MSVLFFISYQIFFLGPLVVCHIYFIGYFSWLLYCYIVFVMKWPPPSEQQLLLWGCLLGLIHQFGQMLCIWVFTGKWVFCHVIFLWWSFLSFLRLCAIQHIHTFKDFSAFPSICLPVPADTMDSALGEHNWSDWVRKRLEAYVYQSQLLAITTLFSLTVPHKVF